MLKKVLCILLCVACILSMVACGNSKYKVNTPKVDSEIYSQRAIHAAIHSVKQHFTSYWKRYILTDLYYAGDDYSDSFEDLAAQYNADEAIVLLSNFSFDESLGANTGNTSNTYEGWKWILVRNKGEKKWKIAAQGYGY